jgi:hypothetical protein
MPVMGPRQSGPPEIEPQITKGILLLGTHHMTSRWFQTTKSIASALGDVAAMRILPNACCRSFASPGEERAVQTKET